MVKISLIALLICVTISSVSQNILPDYDSTLAKTLGADDYGMKNYIFVILKSGNNQSVSEEKRDSIFKGHLKNIVRLANSGKLVVAGPLGKNDKNYRGIFILNVTNFNDAKELLQTDPAIKENLLDVELYEWYGAAALFEYLKVQKKIEKFKFSE